MRIQASWRGYTVRRSLWGLGQSATEIQRVWRGYLGRERFKRARAAKDKELREAYFAAAATVIQRWFRGYYSRLHIHCFNSRKQYLASIQAMNEHVVEEMNGNYLYQLEEQETLAMELGRKRFEGALKGLHHLVSTQSSAGIYNSPFNAVVGGPPTVGGVAIEDHLKSVASGRGSLLQGENRVKSREMRPSRLKLPNDLANPYDSPQSLSPSPTQVPQYMVPSSRPFITAVRGRTEVTEPTVRASAPYISPHKRDVEAKKESTMANITDKPFHTTIHNADLFETSFA